MKDWVIYPMVGIILAVLVIFACKYENRQKAPIVEADGKISGDYTIESIMKIGRPYKCSFLKSDGSSQVSGILQMAENKLRGDFDLITTATSFASHFIVIEDIAYTWTSLEPIGYKGPVAKSASKNASPAEQAQIVGTQDRINYKCEPWLNMDNSFFETPPGVTFTALRN